MEGVGNEYTDLRSPEYQAVIVVDYDDGRMFPLTESIPKCLLPIANRKLLAYQLDMLSKSNVIETFIVTPEEFEAPLKQFIAETHREGMNVEIISLPEMNGTTHALHAVSDRIRGDFFFINSDVLSQVSLMDLANLHRLSISDVTILFTIPNKDMLKDDVDQEYIGLTSEGRIIYKISTLELEGEITLPKTLFQKLQSKPFSMRNDLLDIGIYLFSHWMIDFIKDCYKRMSSIKNDLLPYLIQRQFQNQLYLENKISALKHRKRPLSFLETWLTTKEKNHYSSSLSSYQEPFTDPHHSVPNTPPPPGSLSTSSVKTVGSFQFEGDDNQDHLRVFGLVYSPYGTDSGSTAAAATTPPTLLISRVNTIQTYLTLNKEMPLITHTSRTTWPRLRNFSKKEMSLIGEHVDLGEQIAYRQCFIGNNCKIGKRTKLNNCVIMDGVVIGDNCIIQNSVICEKVVIENNCNLNECNIGMGYKLTAGNEIRGESLAVGSN